MLIIILQLLTTLLGMSSALYIVVQPHPVFAALSLIFLAAITALRWWSYGAFFFSLVLLLIYLGAVLVLFTFVVMTLSQRKSFPVLSQKSWNRYLIVLLSISVFAVYPLSTISPAQYELQAQGAKLLSMEALLPLLLQNAEVLMQMIGAFLLLAMLVAVMLLKVHALQKEEV